MNYHMKSLSFAMIALLAGCQNLPVYERPSLPLTDQYRSQDTNPIEDHKHSSSKAWWRAFIDPSLQDLLTQAISNNFGLQSSEKALAQADAFYQAQQASFTYPKVDATISAQSLRVNPSSLGQVGTGREFDLFQAGLTARYQFDLSGSQRQTLQALAAKTDYQHWQVQANRQSLMGQWLLTAILVAKTQAQQDATQALIALQQEQVNIAQARVNLGLGQEVDVVALQTQLSQTQSTLPTLNKQHQQLIHLLAALSGTTSSNFMLQHIDLAQFTQMNIALVIPSELIQKRPDILASESLAKAAHAEYGLSLTRYYPNITLSASTATQALSTGALFGAGTAIWAFMMQISQPLLDASLPEQERAALLGFEAASLHYQQVVVEAMRQVADGLSAVEQDQHTLAHLEQAEQHAQRLIKLTEQQYRLGTASYLQLLSAQQQLASIHLNRIALTAQQLINQVSLSVAMGMT